MRHVVSAKRPDPFWMCNLLRPEHVKNCGPPSSFSSPNVTQHPGELRTESDIPSLRALTVYINTERGIEGRVVILLSADRGGE